jgi:hypothetical protein
MRYWGGLQCPAKQHARHSLQNCGVLDGEEVRPEEAQAHVAANGREYGIALMLTGFSVDALALSVVGIVNVLIDFFALKPGQFLCVDAG